MQLAIAERGLMVIDAVAKAWGMPANEGINAIYLALQDIQWIKITDLKNIPTLGTGQSTVTQIEAGSQHNVVPGCLPLRHRCAHPGVLYQPGCSTSCGSTLSPNDGLVLPAQSQRYLF